MSFGSFLQGAYGIVKGHVHRSVRCAMTGVGTKAPELEGEQGLLPRAIREGFLEVVALGAGVQIFLGREKMFSATACSPQTPVPGGRCGEGWREASVDSGSPLGRSRGIIEKRVCP